MGSSLRVAIVFGTFPPERNGGADSLSRLAAALAAQGHGVHVLTSPSDAPRREALASGVTVHRIVEDWTVGSASGRAAWRDAERLLRSQRIELTHVFFPDSVLQARYQLPAALGAGRTPLVTTFWNLGLGRRSPLPIRLEALSLLARSAAVTSHDPGYLQALRRLVGWAKPVHWLPVGSNVDAPAAGPRDEVRARLGVGRGPLLGFFGHLDFTRGAEQLFEAVSLLRRRGHDVHLVMIGAAGDPRYGAYHVLPGRLGIEDSVTWTGYVEEAEVAGLLGALDLCVLPYRRNSLGRSALAAALAQGAPTVLSGTAETIAPLRAGAHVALVPPGGGADTLADAVEGLLLDEPARERLAAGAARGARLFAWPRIAATAAGIYRSVLAGAARRSNTA